MPIHIHIHIHTRRTKRHKVASPCVINDGATGNGPRCQRESERASERERARERESESESESESENENDFVVLRYFRSRFEDTVCYRSRSDSSSIGEK